MKKMSRQSFLKAVAACSAATALAACSSDDSTSTGTTTTTTTTTDSAASAEPVEIEFIQWWGAEGGGEYLDELVAKFEAENPDITVKLTTLPFSDSQTTIIASKATNTMPDVLGMNPPWTRSFYDMGILAPLDDLMAADASFNQEDYYQASFAPIDGNIYLAPVVTTAFYLYYNKTMFADAGLDLPTNWQELADYALELTDPANNQYGMTLTMSEQEAANSSILSLYPLLYAANGRTLVDGVYTVETDEMRASMELISQFNTEGSLLPGTTSKGETTMVEEFSIGNTAMMITHSGQILVVNDRNPDLDLGIVAIPSIDGTTDPELRHHGWDVGISSGSEHKEEAWRFISFMINEENMADMCNQMQKLPAMYSVELDYVDEYPAVADTLAETNKYEMVEELMMMPESGTCWTALTQAGVAVISGTKSVDEALADAQAAWDEALGQ